MLAGEWLIIYGDGKQTRSFYYALGMSEGPIALRVMVVQEPVYVHNQKEHTILGIDGGESDLTHASRPEQDPEARRPDIEKARRKLVWEPQESLRDGLEASIDYLQWVL